jgi:hypothetical protein
MAKKDKTGRVITVSKEDNRLFKKYLILLEEMGVDKSPNEVASELFSFGLHANYKSLYEKS